MQENTTTEPGKPEKPPRMQKPRALPLPPTRESIQQNAAHASNLLQSPVLNIAVRSLQEAWMEQSVNTLPSDSAQREHLYLKSRALSEVMLELAGMVQMAQSLPPQALAEEESTTEAWSRHNSTMLRQLDS